MLLQQATLGFTGVPSFINNIGRIENKGIEFEITSNNIRKRDFRWTTSANISRNRNKILQLGDESFLLNQGERGEGYLNKVGDPLSSSLDLKRMAFGFRRQTLLLPDLLQACPMH